MANEKLSVSDILKDPFPDLSKEGLSRANLVESFLKEHQINKWELLYEILRGDETQYSMRLKEQFQYQFGEVYLKTRDPDSEKSVSEVVISNSLKMKRLIANELPENEVVCNYFTSLIDSYAKEYLEKYYDSQTKI